jgi:hypothetical protein
MFLCLGVAPLLLISICQIASLREKVETQEKKVNKLNARVEKTKVCLTYIWSINVPSHKTGQMETSTG